jgi:hypothetical protein
LSAPSGLRLNLGCGARHKPGFINVDMYGEADVRHDLESFPWPWPDDSVAEIEMTHVLEHLGHSPRVYRDLWKEIYRVCAADARLHIVVPHHLHESFFADPTHVRPITPLGIGLLSQSLNLSWGKRKAANTPLGLYWEVDFEIVTFGYKPSADWFRLYPERKTDSNLLLQEGAVHNNLIEEISFDLRAVKPPTSQGQRAAAPAAAATTDAPERSGG